MILKQKITKEWIKKTYGEVEISDIDFELMKYSNDEIEIEDFSDETLRHIIKDCQDDFSIKAKNEIVRRRKEKLVKIKNK